MIDDVVKLSIVRLKVIHPYGYKPAGCDLCKVTGVFYDNDHNRLCLSVLYDNGFSDVIALDDVKNGNYEIQN